jgi:flavodoxin
MIGVKLCAVYYSRSGSTEKIAANFADSIGAKLFKLEDEKPGKSISGFSALLGLGSPLKEPLPDVGGFEFLVLLTPIFAWHPSPQMNTFVNKADLKGKSVFLVGVGAGEANEKALKRFTAKAEKAGANVVGTKNFKGLQMKQDLKEVESVLLESGKQLAGIIERLVQ